MRVILVSFPLLFAVFAGIFSGKPAGLSTVQAQVVSPESARHYACIAFSTHRQEKGQQSIIPTEITDQKIITDQDNIPLCYLFNMTEGGFIILSADLSAVPVIGYNPEKSLDFDQLPPAFQDWLENSAAQIASIRENHFPSTRNILEDWTHPETGLRNDSKSGSRSVEPLLPMIWGQRRPYNMFCPVDPASQDSHAVTGCAATAFAQIMAYYNYPNHGIGSNSYYHPVYGQISANFEEAVYEWDLMLDSVPEGMPSPVQEAPALISYHIGVAMNMFYGPNGSGVTASQILQPMIDHFGYNPEADYALRLNYTDAEWVSLLQEQLDVGFPLIYRGTSPTVGHIFVCDGYQDDEYFHFNWGWFGNANGYFHINNLNPLSWTFNLNNYCIPNFFPGMDYPYYCASCDTMQTSVAYIEDGSGPIFDYQNGADCSWLIAPQTEEPIGQILIHFRQFETEEGHDFLRFYNGPPSTGIMIAEYSGSEIPDLLTVLNDSVWVNFNSDNNGVTRNGWEIMYDAVDVPASIANQQDYSTHKFLLYPNPTSGLLTITSLNQSAEINYIEIRDLAGRVVLRADPEISGKTTERMMDVSSLAHGLYLVRVFDSFSDQTIYRLVVH